MTDKLTGSVDKATVCSIIRIIHSFGKQAITELVESVDILEEIYTIGRFRAG